MPEKRLQPEVDYERSFSNEGYVEAKEVFHSRRNAQEHNAKVVRMAEINGNGGANRQQQGVTNISGNPAGIYSDTRQDGTRMKFYNPGVTPVIEEASKEGAPISPGDDLEWGATAGSHTTQEGEV